MLGSLLAFGSFIPALKPSKGLVIGIGVAAAIGFAYIRGKDAAEREHQAALAELQLAAQAKQVLLLTGEAAAAADAHTQIKDWTDEALKTLPSPTQGDCSCTVGDVSLSACSSPKPVAISALAPLPASLSKACATPKIEAGSRLAKALVTSRAALKACAHRHGRLVSFYREQG